MTASTYAAQLANLHVELAHADTDEWRDELHAAFARIDRLFRAARAAELDEDEAIAIVAVA